MPCDLCLASSPTLSPPCGAQPPCPLPILNYSAPPNTQPLIFHGHNNYYIGVAILIRCMGWYTRIHVLVYENVRSRLYAYVRVLGMDVSAAREKPFSEGMRK